MSSKIADISIVFHGGKRCLSYDLRFRCIEIGCYLPKIPDDSVETWNIDPSINGLAVRFAHAYKWQDHQFVSFGRVGVVNLSVNISARGQSFANKMILYRHDASYGSIDVVESIFNIQGKSPMYLKNDCLEFMDTDGIVWRLEFDCVEYRDVILSGFQHFGGTITNIPSDTDMTGMHIPNAIPKASLNVSDTDAKDQEILQLKNRADQYERRIGQMEEMMSKLLTLITRERNNEASPNQ